MLGNDDNIPICGGRHESHLDGYSEDIKSKDIVNFHYNCSDFDVEAKIEEDELLINCTGGGKYNQRDGSYFHVRYKTKNYSILKRLQEVIDNNHETNGNGNCTHVDGLPPGYGDNIEVLYESGEKIYKINNQCPTVSDESKDEFYKIFHEFVVKDGYDFNTKGSNVKLFDDATNEYVQGTWNGTHFGDKISVSFEGDRVKIYVDDKLTDDEEYTIYEGRIVPNRLKEDKNDASSYHDYDYFKGLSLMQKKNYFTMTAYFMEDGYSTCDLMNFNKEKPKEEEI